VPLVDARFQPDGGFWEGSSILLGCLLGLQDESIGMAEILFWFPGSGVVVMGRWLFLRVRGCESVEWRNRLSFNDIYGVMAMRNADERNVCLVWRRTSISFGRTQFDAGSKQRSHGKSTPKLIFKTTRRPRWITVQSIRLDQEASLRKDDLDYTIAHDALKIISSKYSRDRPRPVVCKKIVSTI
jgi:hypothetical protein